MCHFGRRFGLTGSLTTGVDAVSGTDKNDVINGLGDTASATLTAADTIAGGAGTDTLAVTFTAAGADITAGALISGIEVVKVRASAAAANSSETVLDATKVVGMTEFNANLSTNAVKVTGLATGAAVGITGNSSIVNGGLNFASTTASNAVTVNLDGGVKQTAGVAAANAGGNVGLGIFNASNAATTATINSTGATNTTGGIQLSAAATVTALTINASSALVVTDGAGSADIIGFGGTSAKITIAGAATNVAATSTAAEKGAVSIGTIEAATVKTIDASGLTAGGLEAVLSANTTIAVTGGAGNDRITTGSVLTTGSVNAGAGTADVLVVAAGGTHIADATLGGKYTNFEVLGLNDSQNVSFVSGITALELNTMDSKTVSGITATQAAAITVKGSLTTAATLTLADATGTADVVSLNLKSDTAATNVNVAGLSVIGVETLNIAGTTGTAATSSAVDFAAAGADKLTAINITGTADVSLSGTNTSKAVTVTSTTTGIATVTGNFVNASTITTGAGKDVITLGTGFGTYNTGAADDAISGTLAQYRTTTSYNTINAGDGTDTVNITGGAALTMVDDDFKGLTGVEKITVATTTTNNQSITTGGWFDANFKASGVTLTTTSTDGNITIVAGSFTGNLTVVATTADTAGADAGIVTITTGSGNDNVTVSDTGSAAGTVSTGAGNDIIIGGAVVETITGGAGTDTMTGGGGNDIYVFGAADSVAGTALDVITDFSTASDVIDFAATAVLLAADATTAVAGSNVTQDANGMISFATADNTYALKVVAIQADAQLDVANSTAIFVDSGNTYVYNAGAATGNADDLIIQLTGVTGAAFDTITVGGGNITIG